MKYSIAALVFQVFALLLGLAALGLEGYVYYCDHKWYKIVMMQEPPYFETFLERFYQHLRNKSAALINIYGPFQEHHRVRTRPMTDEASEFLRHPMTELNIYITFLIFTVLMQLVALIVTIARKCHFLPRPCRENGWWHLIIGIIALIGVLTEVCGRLKVNSNYDTFTKSAESTNANEKTGAIMLVSCGPSYESYEKLLTSKTKEERDEMCVCQMWYFFLASVSAEGANILLCFLVALLLCIFWKKKKNVAQADAEENANDTNQPVQSPPPKPNYDTNNNNRPPPAIPQDNYNNNAPQPGPPPNQPYQMAKPEQKPNKKSNTPSYKTYQKPNQKPPHNKSKPPDQKANYPTEPKKEPIASPNNDRQIPDQITSASANYTTPENGL